MEGTQRYGREQNEKWGGSGCAAGDAEALLIFDEALAVRGQADDKRVLAKRDIGYNTYYTLL